MTDSASPFAIRGIIEGFYGRPWSWAERHSMLDFMGRHGLNTYMYGPKNDPIHRNRWREPYLPWEWAQFRDFAAHAREVGVTFVFGLSPLAFHFSDPRDLECLLTKVRGAQAVGIEDFCVLVDDMPERFRHEDDAERFGTLGHAHAWLVNEIRAVVQGELHFTPTEYHGEGDSPYLRTIGELIHPSVRIHWMGREVCSHDLRTEDARVISASLRRPVVYWDNYPVNDLEMRFRMHLFPYEFRDSDLWTASGGILAAAGLQPEAHKIPLATIAEYLRDPQGYDSDAAWRRALLEITGAERPARALALLADLGRHSSMHRTEGSALDNHLYPLLDAFWAALGGVPDEAGPELATRPPRRNLPASTEALKAAIHELELAVFELEHLTNRDLQREIAPWVSKLGGWVRIAKLSVAAVENPHDERLREVIMEDLLLVREEFAWVAGDMIDQFARRCLWYVQTRQATPEVSA